MSESIENVATDLETADELIGEMVENDASVEECLPALLTAGFKAGKSMALIKQLMESKGKIMSAKERTATATEYLTSWDFANNVADYSDVERFANSLTEEMEATTKAQALGSIKKYATANKIELPSKPKGVAGSRSNKFDDFYAFALKNPSCSEVEISLFIETFGSTEGQNKKYVWLFNGILGFAKKYSEV